MTGKTSLIRGTAVLRQLLQEHCFDLRRLELAEFRSWLEQHLRRWEQDSVFAHRAVIRRLRRSHPRLQALEREYRRAAAADAAAPSHPRLQQLAKQLRGTEQAIAGLSGALCESAPHQREARQQKLDSFRDLQRTLHREQEELIRTSPERQALLRVEDQLQKDRTAVGLDRAQATLTRLLRERGQRSGRAGTRFEQWSTRLIQTEIVPEFVGEIQGAEAVQILRGVTLGAARIEIDALLIRQPSSESEPIEALALVEAKRNINDLAHGFRHRQENLAWLTGDTTAYDPDAYRTARFTSGHFDRPTIHRHGDRSYLVTPDSFANFHRDPATQLFLDRLYLITRPGPLWGLSSAALHRLSYRISTDVAWDPEDPSYLQRLWHWCRGLTHELEAPDVVRIFASAEPHAGQVLLTMGAPPPRG